MKKEIMNKVYSICFKNYLEFYENAAKKIKRLEEKGISPFGYIQLDVADYDEEYCETCSQYTYAEGIFQYMGYYSLWNKKDVHRILPEIRLTLSSFCRMDRLADKKAREKTGCNKYIGSLTTPVYARPSDGIPF